MPVYVRVGPGSDLGPPKGHRLDREPRRAGVRVRGRCFLLPWDPVYSPSVCI